MSISSQLRTPIHKLCSGICNSQLPSLLDFCLEEDLVALLPAFGNQRLAWEDGARESDLDVLEGAVFLVDSLGGDTEEAQTVQDGHWETADFGEFWVDVKRALESLLVFVSLLDLEWTYL